MISQTLAWPVLGLLLNSVSAGLTHRGTPLKLTVKHQGSLKPRINADCPDTSIIQTEDGCKLQLQKTLGEWDLKQEDGLPDKGWTTGEDTRAPDIRRVDNGDYIVYLSPEIETSRHCIGVARCKNATGPNDQEPLICGPEDHKGAIDASDFKDAASGKHYLICKLEGDATGPTGGTPIMLQEIEGNGTTFIGKPVKIFDRIGSKDGVLVEAPNFVRLGNGKYVLFFSSHDFRDPLYNLKYAYVDKLSGLYIRAPEPLIAAPDFGLDAPGGATSNEVGDTLVFHGWCPDDKNIRCMYSIE
ncbi:glycosyl hydrolase [Fusarium avenaceum]|nr:glycosyl hydrolase [Fusarium avenaceum]